MTTGKIIVLTIWTFVGKVMPLLFNMLSGFVIAFLPRSRCILVSWLQSPSAVILEPKPLKWDFTNRKKCFPEANGELKAVSGFRGGEERDCRGKRKHTLGSAAAAGSPWGSLQILLCCGNCPEQWGISNIPGLFPRMPVALPPHCANLVCPGEQSHPQLWTTAPKRFKPPSETGRTTCSHLPCAAVGQMVVIIMCLLYTYYMPMSVLMLGVNQLI